MVSGNIILGRPTGKITHMTVAGNAIIKILILFIGLICLSISSIWAVTYYINQDGTPHLYNAYLILEILKGNDSIRQFASLNPHLVPNLTGHLILAFLLLFFEPATTTKIMVTLTFAAFVASVGWLRFQVAGMKGLGTSLLFGAVIAFNWLWFLGFYNFALSASAFSFSLGLWWRWREIMDLKRAFCLYLLLMLTFLSHLVSFGLLIGGIFFLLMAHIKTVSRKSALWTIGMLAATIPWIINYLWVSQSGGGIDPQWRYLQNPFSISNWVIRLNEADPFVLISRKAVPFVVSTTPAFAIFSSILWMMVALLLLGFAMYRWRRAPAENALAYTKSWAFLSIILVAIWAFGPDDFGTAHGGGLRQRALILGFVCIVPFFKLSPKRYINITAQACLIFVILFQTLVLWDYSLRNNSVAKQFYVAKDQIGQNESIGSIVFIADTRRFRPIPLSNLTPYLGIGKNAPVWDNFEFGFYYFPVVTNTPEERSFVFNFRESNTYDLNDPNENVAEKRNKLESVLAANHNRIDVLLVWNEQADFVSLRQRWFENEPYFESGELKLFRHR